MDAISSAIGPAIIEATTGTDSTNNSAGAVGGGARGKAAAAETAATAAAFQSTGTTTARDRNNRRRRNGDLAVGNIGTYIRGSHQREGGRDLQRPPFGDPGDGASKDSLAAGSNIGGGGSRDCAGDGGGIMNEETMVWNGVAFAEARRKMLDPPKVGGLPPSVQRHIRRLSQGKCISLQRDPPPVPFARPRFHEAERVCTQTWYKMGGLNAFHRRFDVALGHNSRRVCSLSQRGGVSCVV